MKKRTKYFVILGITIIMILLAVFIFKNNDAVKSLFKMPFMNESAKAEPEIVADTDETIILKNSDGSYLLYNNAYINKEFTFVITNDAKKDSVDELYFIKSAKDTSKDDARNIAYVNDYNKSSLNSDKTGFLFAKDKDTGDYIVNGEKIDLTKALDADLLDKVSNKIKVDLTQSSTTVENINNVETERKVGKIVITDNAKSTYSYNLVKVDGTSDENYVKLFELAEKLLDDEQINTLSFMEKLNLLKEYQDLYSQLEPKDSDKSWINVKNKEILQPENSKASDKYIVFIKKVDTDGSVTNDVQYLNSFEAYDSRYEDEEVNEPSSTPSTTPDNVDTGNVGNVENVGNTSDSTEDKTEESVVEDNQSDLPTTFDVVRKLFVVLATLVILFGLVLFIRIKAFNKKGKN